MNNTIPGRGRTEGILLLAAAGLVVSLAYVLSNLVGSGHASFNTTSSGVTWGLPIVNYVFFALMSTGLTLVASLALVFGAPAFYPVAKRCVWLSIASVVAGFASLAFELGHPFRLLWTIPLNFQYQSPLMWMGLFYAVFLVLGLLKFWKLHTGDWDSPASRTLGIAALAAEVLAALTLGSAFGMMAMRPFWWGPEVPVNFLVTGATSGAAMAMLAAHWANAGGPLSGNVRPVLEGWMPRVLAAVVGVFFLMVVYRSIGGLWSNADGLQVWDRIVRGPAYWLVLAALVAAFALLALPAMRGQPAPQVAAAVLVLLAVFANRYEFVIGGQLVPVFKGAWVPGLIDYSPSATEWMLTLMSVSVMLLVYAIGERALDLADAPAPGERHPLPAGAVHRLA
jgi:Ni/Fe-hydrogenase subunit HybB-like protein